jgi:hypothetical protein
MPRFMARGKSKVIFTPTVAGVSPTRPEITAGTSLTPQIAEMSGFSFSNSPIATPDMDTTFTTTIAGEDTSDTPSMTFYDDDTVTTIRTALAKGTKGYLLLMRYGDVPTKAVQKWYVESTGISDEWSAGNDPARFSVSFGVLAVPVFNGVIPA